MGIPISHQVDCKVNELIMLNIHAQTRTWSAALPMLCALVTDAGPSSVHQARRLGRHTARTLAMHHTITHISHVPPNSCAHSIIGPASKACGVGDAAVILSADQRHKLRLLPIRPCFPVLILLRALVAEVFQLSL